MKIDLPSGVPNPATYITLLPTASIRISRVNSLWRNSRLCFSLGILSRQNPKRHAYAYATIRTSIVQIPEEAVQSPEEHLQEIQVGGRNWL